MQTVAVLKHTVHFKRAVMVLFVQLDDRKWLGNCNWFDAERGRHQHVLVLCPMFGSISSQGKCAFLFGPVQETDASNNHCLTKQI